ncbi:hypothetical protein [Duganella phyllosphaerae]|uniref:hypothetical protein n=1 Tax=Duganella phyllosphaerae TaxID=762836 RepID=UPI00114CD53F|nr:hypothetical protein [Duganella phyllosphaerae]
MLLISVFKYALFFESDGIIDSAKLIATGMMVVSIYFILKYEAKIFFRWYFIATGLLLIYGLYQYLIVFSGLPRDSTGVNLPVNLWNESAWHLSIIRDGLIRVQSFAYEPAYLAIFLGFSLLCATSFKVKKRWLIAICLGLLATGSRNTFVFLFVFFGLMAIKKYMNGFMFGVIYFFSFLLPIFLFVFVDLEAGDFDVSVLARALPYKVVAENITGDLWAAAFGVPSYTDAIVQNNYLARFSEVLVSEKVDEDPRSFLAYLLLHFGVVGFLAFIFFQWLLLRKSKTSLIYMSSFNLLCFNSNVLFWPVYWCVYTLSIFIQDEKWRFMLAPPANAPILPAAVPEDIELPVKER